MSARGSRHGPVVAAGWRHKNRNSPRKLFQSFIFLMPQENFYFFGGLSEREKAFIFIGLVIGLVSGILLTIVVYKLSPCLRGCCTLILQRFIQRILQGTTQAAQQTTPSPQHLPQPAPTPQGQQESISLQYRYNPVPIYH